MMHTCPRERDLVHDLRSGTLSAPVAAHASECPVCGESLRLARHLGALAAAEPPPTHLPGAGAIWWKAEIIRRLTSQVDEPIRRVTGPAFWGLTLGLAASGAALLASLTWLVAAGQAGAGPATGPMPAWGWLQTTALALVPAAVLATLGLLWREA